MLKRLKFKTIEEVLHNSSVFEAGLDMWVKKRGGGYTSRILIGEEFIYEVNIITNEGINKAESTN